MLELGTFGSVRGVPGNGYPYVILGRSEPLVSRRPCTRPQRPSS
jgi:hypothetical protein